MDYTNYLTPGQSTVGSSDQPLYAIKAKIQWSLPLKFPIKQYFAFMGGLHIEQECLVILGQLITGSGLEDILEFMPIWI